MTEILVAVDGSKQSGKVVDMAVALAKSMRAKVVLAYVAPKLNVPDEYEKAIEEDAPDQDDYYKEFSDRMLGDLDDRIKSEKLTVEKIYGVGNPVEFILSKAKERKSAMIVVGVTGLHRLGMIRALGSTSRRIIENSPIPVVTVP